MRFLTFFAATVCSFAQPLPPLVDIAAPLAWMNSVGNSKTATDAQGNVYLLGTLPDSATLPDAKFFGTRGDFDLFVIKFDPTLHQTIYSVVIGSAFIQVQAISVDQSGQVFVAGSSIDGGFLLRLNAAGDDFQWLYRGPVSATAVAVDNAGAVYVGGGTSSSQLVGTPGAYQPVANGNQVFLMKLDATTGAVQSATYLNAAQLIKLVLRPDGGVAYFTERSLGALNAALSTLVFETPLARFPLDAASGGDYYYVVTGAPDLRQYSSNGELNWAINLPRGTFGIPSAVGSDGTVYMPSVMGESNSKTRNALEACVTNTLPPLGAAGLPPSPVYPTTSGLTIFRPDGTVKYASRTSANLASMSTSGPYLYSVTGRVLYDQTGRTTWTGMVRLDLRNVPTVDHLAPQCIVQGASFVAGAGSPGQIMTIFGNGLGPAQGESFQLRDGLVPATLAGTDVTVDGKPAPVLYAQDEQINFIVPWQTRTDGVITVCVTRSAERACLPMTATAMSAGIFGSIALLQDGTVNSSSNPVRPDGYVSLYLTGLGAMDSTVPDGSISGLPLQRVVGHVQAQLQDTVQCSNSCQPRAFPTPEVSYAGSAPTLVSGVQQVNVHIPPDAPLGLAFLVLQFPDSPITNAGIALWILRSPIP